MPHGKRWPGSVLELFAFPIQTLMADGRRDG